MSGQAPSNLPGKWRWHVGIGDQTQHGKPQRRSQQGQLTTRERQVRPYGVAERLVVPAKPGNSGGGKGPQLKTNARSDEVVSSLLCKRPSFVFGVAVVFGDGLQG